MTAALENSSKELQTAIRDLLKINPVVAAAATDKEEEDLARKYGITYQHTYVQIDGVGKEVTKWNGGQINELLSNIK